MAKASKTRKSPTDVRKRPKRVPLSPSPAEYERWLRAAQKKKLPLATWAFTVVSEAADKELGVS